MVLTKAQILAFEQQSKEEWLERLRVELKGKPEAELDWEIEDGIILKPYYTIDESSESNSLPSGWLSSSWKKIGSVDPSGSIAQIRSRVLEELEGGMERVLLNINALSAEGIQELIDSTTQVTFVTSDLLVYNFVQDRLSNFGIDQTHKIRFDIGTFDQLIKEGNQILEDEKCELCISINENPESSISSESIACSLLFANGLIEKFDLKKIQGIIRRLIFKILPNEDYLKNILYIRAWHKAMHQLMSYYPEIKNRPTLESQIDVSFEPDSFRQMILGTTMATSAVVAGADQLCILPFHEIENVEQGTSERISRNIHHIMELESYLDRQDDFVKGSYYFEIGSEKIAKHAWESFLEHQKK